MMCKNLVEVRKRVAAMLPPLIADGWRIIGRVSTSSTHFVTLRHCRKDSRLTITATCKEYSVIVNGKTKKREQF